MNASTRFATNDETTLDRGPVQPPAYGDEQASEPVTISSPASSLIEEGEVIHFLPVEEHVPSHPLIPSDLPLTPAMVAEIRASIAEIGQQSPIVLLIVSDGQRYVLDGRTRRAACQELGIPTKYVTLCEDDLRGQTPAEWIIARHAANGATRRLTDTQQALLAAILCKEYERAAKERQQHQPAAAGQETGKSYELAAARLNVRPNAVRQARAVIDDLEVLELVRAGRLSLSTAASIARNKTPDRECALQQALGAEFARKRASCSRDSLKLARRLRGLIKDAERIGGPAGWSLASVCRDLAAAAARIEHLVPSAPCGECGTTGCQTCDGRGWLIFDQPVHESDAAGPDQTHAAAKEGSACA